MKFYLAKRPDGPPKVLTRKDEAHKLDKNAEQIDVPVDQEGLRCALQDFYNHVHMLEQQVLESPTTEASSTATPPAEPKPESYAEKANRFEDEFDVMPLALQLHYGARAMENARDKLCSE